MLLLCPKTEIRRFPSKKLRLVPAEKRSSVPAPAYIFPNCAFFIPRRVMTFIVRFEFPSSKPENCAWSLSLSKTWILLTTSAGKFFKAMEASSPKNSLPSINTFFTSSPPDFTTPLSTVMPGIFFTRSSAVASGFTLNASALISVVSPF